MSPDWKSSSSGRLLILTDLDGTLLDFETYRAGVARRGLSQLQACGIPVVFCSSKTREEQEWHRHELKVTDPFIAENGAAIFVPCGYFGPPGLEVSRRRGYEVMQLGRPREDILRQLEGM